MNVRKVRRTIEEWEEWLRPYVERKVFQRRKNQYDKNMTESYCYSIKRVPFGLMVEHKVSKSAKWVVDGTCVKCGEKFQSSWSNLWLKKAFKGLEVCGRCSRKEQFTEEWRKNNSEAQKRVQGTQEARCRMSNILRQTWKNNPTIREKISRSLKKTYDGNVELRKKIGDAARRNWERVEYQEKVSGCGYHHGWFISKWGRIYFASSWELMFLIWCESNSVVTECRRSEDVIPYDKPYDKPDKGLSYYHPDFDVVILNSHTVVEVKGGRSDLDLVERKRIAAEKFYYGKKDYVLLYREDLIRMGIMKSEKTIVKWISAMVLQGKVDGYGFGKKH